MITRLLGAARALLLGVAFSFATYRWQMPYTHPSPAEAHAWVFTSIPFAGLALLIVLGLRRSASVLGWIVLAALTVVAFVVGAHLGARGSCGDDAVFLQILYGTVVLVHLRAHQRPRRPEESMAAMKTNTKTPRTLGIVLLVYTASPLSRARRRGIPARWAWFLAALLGLLVLFVEVTSTQPGV